MKKILIIIITLLVAIMSAGAAKNTVIKKEADKIKLGLLVKEAENLLNDSIEGVEPGNYKTGSKEGLAKAHTGGANILAKKDANINQVNSITRVLEEAIEVFKAGIVEKIEYKPVEKGFVRVHYNRQDDKYENLGIWTWNDVKKPSEGWPKGAAAINPMRKDDYGIYVDIELNEEAEKIGFLIVNTETGEKDGGDKGALFTGVGRDLYIVQGSDEVKMSKPINIPENVLRIHYNSNDGIYDTTAIWLAEGAAEPSVEWPTGAAIMEGNDEFGKYCDVKLGEGGRQIKFSVVNTKTGEKDGGDRSFGLADKYNQIWLKSGDANIYISPEFDTAMVITKAIITGKNNIDAVFTDIDNFDVNEIIVTDRENNKIEITSAEISGKANVSINVKIDIGMLPYTVSYKGKKATAAESYNLIDDLYYYDGDDLGLTFTEEAVVMKLWAPKAAKVVAVLYDKDNKNKTAGRLNLVKGEKGVWSAYLKKGVMGIENFDGYFYQYEVTNNGIPKLVLDPYAKSMAEFDVDTEGHAGEEEDYAGKGAIVNPAKIGDEIALAAIDGYNKKTDAIIWEIHIRDFTSNPVIEEKLNGKRWGSYKAFAEMLPYIKKLGVTHIQFMPVMSWYYGDEKKAGEREVAWSAKGNNYNWGYDPHNYFSPEGMYSENPKNPSLRIAEFKGLVDAIHKSGMGVILDVVYTHVAKAEILNDIVPDYYFFKDQNGKLTGGFGNNIGTTHKMAKKLIVDSVKYWFSEYKIDGMRWDMMGDAASDAVEEAFDAAYEINPDAVFIGEGWRTFSGREENPGTIPMDQDYMDRTNSAAVFSDEMRNELKSGFGSEGQARFVTGGPRDIKAVFNNIKGEPSNVSEDSPEDIVQYVSCHDNLTLHDVIAFATKQDPRKSEIEIQKRIRLANTLILTSQGAAFLHGGQEYGITKQWGAGAGRPQQKYNEFRDKTGKVFGYFINDSYDSSDLVNMFDWDKVEKDGIYKKTAEYTAGLIELRKSTDAFRLGSKKLVDSNVKLINAEGIAAVDVVIVYAAKSQIGDEYYVIINGDDKVREIKTEIDLSVGSVIVDSEKAGVLPINEPAGIKIDGGKIIIDPLTAVVIKK